MTCITIIHTLYRQSNIIVTVLLINNQIYKISNKRGGTVALNISMSYFCYNKYTLIEQINTLIEQSFTTNFDEVIININLK